MTLDVQPAIASSTTGKTPMLLDVLTEHTTEFVPMPTHSEHDHKFTFILVSTAPVRESDIERPLLVADLGWTRDEAAAARAQLATFAEDWEAPEMDAYDAL